MENLFRLNAAVDAAGLAVSPETRLIKASAWAKYLAAEEITAEARRYAQDLRRQAKEAFEAEKRRGYEQGALEARQEQAEQIMDAALKAIEYIEGLEKGVSALVGEALRKIMGAIPKEELIAGVVRQALALARGQKQVALRVAPEDAEALKTKLSDITREYASIAFVDVQPDGRLAPGSCLLQSEMGIVDAGVETQIRAIVNALEKTRRG